MTHRSLIEDVCAEVLKAKDALYSVRNLLAHVYKYEHIYYKADDLLEGVIALQRLLPDDDEPGDE